MCGLSLCFVCCSVKWARDRLLAQHATSPEYNFILCQRQGDLPSFELLSLVETGAPGDSQQVKAVHFSINKLPNHKYQARDASSVVSQLGRWKVVD